MEGVRGVLGRVILVGKVAMVGKRAAANRFWLLRNLNCVMRHARHAHRVLEVGET